MESAATEPAIQWGVPIYTGPSAASAVLSIDDSRFDVKFFVTETYCEVIVPAIPWYYMRWPNPGDPCAMLAEIVDAIGVYLSMPAN